MIIDLDEFDADGPSVWSEDEIEAQIEEIFDQHREGVFRAKVKAWGAANWVEAEELGVERGREARRYLEAGEFGPAVVWAGTCTEIIFRDLMLRPIMVGLFLGDAWAEKATSFMLRHRWLSKDARLMVHGFLKSMISFDVAEATWPSGAGPEVRLWDEIPKLLALRNRVVHEGYSPTPEEAKLAVNAIAGFYAVLLPRLRELCGISEIPGYSPPRYTGPAVL